jgi:hypothetical protein
VPSSLSPYLWFLCALGALIPLQQWLDRHLQGLLLLVMGNRKRAFRAYAAVLLPGVALHEASHWLAARLVGVTTQGFSLRPARRADGSFRLGYVQTAKVDPLRSVIIGTAPLIAGVAVLILIGFRGMGLDALGESVLAGAWGEVPIRVRGILATPGLGWWLYLALVVSNSMMPSEADRASWLPAGILLAAIGGAVAYLGFGPALASWVEPPLTAALRTLASVFTLTAGLDIVFGLPLRFAEWLIGRLVGREIVY